jgi:H+-transporting ATPase
MNAHELIVDTARTLVAGDKGLLAINARVKREGKWVTPPARELVPGDVIRVRPGDIVPADCALAGGRPGGGGSV